MPFFLWGAEWLQQNIKKKIISLCDGMILDITEQIIKKDREIIDLSHYETIILTTLIENQNSLITSAQLESILFQTNPLRKGALRTTIWRLRKKLPKCISIENVYNSGYKIKF